MTGYVTWPDTIVIQFISNENGQTEPIVVTTPTVSADYFQQVVNLDKLITCNIAIREPSIEGKDITSNYEVFCKNVVGYSYKAMGNLDIITFELDGSRILISAAGGKINYFAGA